MMPYSIPLCHQAVAAIESPDAAARAAVHIVDCLLGELLGPRDVVPVVGVATVDHDVAGVELAGELVKGGLYDPGGHHDPQRSRLVELAQQVLQRGRSDCAFAS